MFDPDEWTGPFVVRTPFSTVQAGSQQNGGSVLYVERVPGATATDGGPLCLMYDFINSPSLGLTPASSFFDVFFQVPDDGEDYVVRILPGVDDFLAFEKDAGTTSTLNPDGSFDLSDPVWAPVSAADLAEAQFHTAIGFGASPDLADPHLRSELQLSVRIPGFAGFYSPEPAFWSASVRGAAGSSPGSSSSGDPPISSAIFRLDPTGGPPVVAVPVLGPNGSPVQQPQAVVPEPSTPALVGLGLVACAVACAARRRGRSSRRQSGTGPA